jgi:hypothetical protein
MMYILLKSSNTPSQGGFSHQTDKPPALAGIHSFIAISRSLSSTIIHREN